MTFKKTTLLIIACSLSLYSCQKEQGCTDITACNFSATAEDDDGSCFSPGDECDDESNNTINDTYGTDCNCEGVSALSDCMDADACNYNASATSNNGSSCIYIGDSCNDNNPSTINDEYNLDCTCEGTMSDVGCMVPSACNYNPSANTADNSCVYPGDSCDDNNSNTINDTINSNCDCQGTTSESGCMNSSACNYNANANTEDNSCVYPGDSCDDNNSNTINDTINANCYCVGETTSESCALNGNGAVDLEIVIYTDAWPEENTIVLLNSSGIQLFNPVTPEFDESYNGWNWSNSTNGDDLTVLVTDAYGDGIVSPGYFVIRCLSTSGQTVNLIPETTWDTGAPKNPNTPISISVDFTIP